MQRLEVNAANLSLEQRNTSVDKKKIEKSPSQLLMSPRLRILLSTLHRLFFLHKNPSVVQKRHAERQKQQQKYYDLHTGKELTFNRLKIQLDDKNWAPAIFVNKCDKLRS